jgi:ribosomal protein S18 acetylase RimI-like enzyme
MNIVVRNALSADLAKICALYEADLGRISNPDRIGELLESYPSAIAQDDEGNCLGFIFSQSFAPDAIELASLLVAISNRDLGIGSGLLAHFEREASIKYKSVILSNSLLYGQPRNGVKRSARVFYERAGYSVIHETADTIILVKSL